jgi:site-specific recombinase
MIAAYREQSKIIEQHLDKSKETINLANIEKSIQMLVALKVNGKSIDELYQAEQMRQVCDRLWLVLIIWTRAVISFRTISCF